MKNKSNELQTFGHHLRELRRRLFWVAAFFLVGSGIGIIFNEQLIHLIQAPLGQTLYFTSPMGGLGFSMQLCLLTGILVAAPAIIYHILKFIQPASRNLLPRRTGLMLVASMVLAVVGLCFGYFVSLPNALHFLTKFGGHSLQALITTDQYFSFVLSYLGGSILIFQLPLIMLIINRIKPLGPSQLKKYQPHVIVISFVAAAILTPTPDPINQAILAAPMIGLFELSCLLVLAVNFRFGSKKNAVLATPPSRAAQQPAYMPNPNLAAPTQPQPARLVYARPAVLDLSQVQLQSASTPVRRITPMVDIRPAKI